MSKLFSRIKRFFAWLFRHRTVSIVANFDNAIPNLSPEAREMLIRQIKQGKVGLSMHGDEISFVDITQSPYTSIGYMIKGCDTRVNAIVSNDDPAHRTITPPRVILPDPRMGHTYTFTPGEPMSIADYDRTLAELWGKIRKAEDDELESDSRE